MKMMSFRNLKEKANKALMSLSLTLAFPAVALANTAAGGGKPDRSQLKGFGEYSTNAPIDQTLWKLGGAVALLVGMGLAGYALFVVAGALIGEFADLRTGKGSLGKLVGLLVIGVAVIIFVYFLVTKALDLFGV
ncbi:DUF2976 domain-containing protein [Mannheimia haemolytica]|uniref:DUF2976 domain-containing protein n=2 Tax=Mannheimia haemolytica TaxID=75985 RepID=UPI00201C26B8|nr:DUF2976 domain-containing protein [Mannheimia haemolytica]MDW0618395.1 DUF2976 domain-containing protein [Mannheimia haemolytica]UQX68822.1 DUF2976 domain-containing protein [Mannheimia haemolytica]UQX80551.1 DUF2976 domain-containing protein [Mannheimia haemolytica]HDL1261818.1 DUF2976 domain-containing protein [Mannheimia haemolytica]